MEKDVGVQGYNWLGEVSWFGWGVLVYLWGVDFGMFMVCLLGFYCGYATLKIEPRPPFC